MLVGLYSLLKKPGRYPEGRQGRSSRFSAQSPVLSEEKCGYISKGKMKEVERLGGVTSRGV
jgi:hypothetical protein